MSRIYTVVHESGGPADIRLLPCTQSELTKWLEVFLVTWQNCIYFIRPLGDERLPNPNCQRWLCTACTRKGYQKSSGTTSLKVFFWGEGKHICIYFVFPCFIPTRTHLWVIFLEKSHGWYFQGLICTIFIFNFHL